MTRYEFISDAVSIQSDVSIASNPLSYEFI